jgi:hypothetical protein
MLGPFVFGPIGLMLWGGALGNQLNLYIAIAGTGITYAVVCAVATIGITYMVDSYKPLSADTITVLQIFRGIFAFAVSFTATPWTLNSGYIRMSGFMTLIEGGLLLTTIPLYIYGARIRRWTTERFKLY